MLHSKRSNASSPAVDLDKRLWDLLVLHNLNRIDYNNRKWETVKFFQTIISALLAASLAAIYAMIGKSIPTAIYNCIVIFPIIAAVASILALVNLKRESKLLFLEELQMLKIAKFIGLDIEVPENKQWIRGDSFLLLSKWRSPAHGTGRDDFSTVEEWLSARSNGHRFNDTFQAIFVVQFVGSLAIIATVLYSSHL